MACPLHMVRWTRYCAKHALEQLIYNITYLPHEAVAEVSKDKEPIGKGACGVQLIRKSIEIWPPTKGGGVKIVKYNFSG